jgi:branched-chain amino acid transport system permease protein
VLALRDDDVRAEALGFPTYRYKLVVFVVAGALGGCRRRAEREPAGLRQPERAALDAVGNADGDGHPRRRRDGLGRPRRRGVLLLLQEVLASTTEHHEFWTGWVLLAVVLFARQGIVGLWTRRRAPSLS